MGPIEIKRAPVELPLCSLFVMSADILERKLGRVLVSYAKHSSHSSALFTSICHFQSWKAVLDSGAHGKEWYRRTLPIQATSTKRFLILWHILFASGSRPGPSFAELCLIMADSDISVFRNYVTCI